MPATTFVGHEVPVDAAGSGESVENGFAVEEGQFDVESGRVTFQQGFPDGNRTVRQQRINIQD